MAQIIKKPLLTIAIPTYNNHKYLLEQLNRLRLQITDEVYIYIIDNNSLPSVEDYLKNNDFDTNNWRIYKNDTNIGPDLNIYKCITLSETDWTWVLSDNDLIEQNVISNVLNLIKEKNDSFFINFGYLKDFEGRGLKDFCLMASYVNSFAISNCIYNMSYLKSQLPIYKESIKTHQGQLVFILNYLALNQNAKFVLSQIKIFNESLTPQWPKSTFLVDSIGFFEFVPETVRIYIKNSRFGKRILGMQIILLSISRAFEKKSIKKILFILKDIIKESSVKQIFSLQFFKSLFYLMISMVFPNVYRSNSKRLFNKSFEPKVDKNMSDFFK